MIELAIYKRYTYLKVDSNYYELELKPLKEKPYTCSYTKIFCPTPEQLVTLKSLFDIRWDVLFTDKVNYTYDE